MCPLPAGQERFRYGLARPSALPSLPSLTPIRLSTPSSRSVTRSYYRGAAALVLTYDITRRQTFTALPRWLADARALASEGLKVVLVGTKSDLEEEREVSSLEAGRWAEDNVSRALPFLLCSGPALPLGRS